MKCCLKGDRSVAQVTHDFDIDLTVSAVHGWVRQAEIDAVRGALLASEPVRPTGGQSITRAVMNPGVSPGARRRQAPPGPHRAAARATKTVAAAGASGPYILGTETELP